MRQFPQDTLLMAMFERGELSEELVIELAKAIARFHRKTATNDYIRSFGKVEQVREAIDQNYEQTEKYIGIAQTQEQFDDCRQYTDRLFADCQHWFDRRIAQDKIRECHGDIHLNNIAYWNDQLLLFDCIEFNEPFRFVDTMFDVAYIVRDFDSGDRQDLTTLFLNTYLEQTGDWEGLQVLPFYVNRQAYVRAKILSFLLDDPAIPASDKAGIQKLAARFYRQAWRYCQQQQGCIILISGLSGAGKSTTARTLAKQLNAIHLRSDAVRKHLGGISVEDRGDASLYTPEMHEKTYDRLLELGLLLAESGYTVILDAKYDRQHYRQAAIEQAKSHDMPLQILFCDAPAEVRRDRVAQRTGDIADATVDLLPQQEFDPFTETEQSYVQVLDTTQAIDPQLASLIKTSF
ncbi:AAA family ATPase [Microcoleus sp. FACHB-1515]|uniref:bifunctional aminoglycoside phosphotransferase/ATP-binding protein n=2 Tax=Cyanophyceae TaxID=3028117 RepID=UPI0037CA68C4